MERFFHKTYRIFAWVKSRGACSAFALLCWSGFACSPTTARALEYKVDMIQLAPWGAVNPDPSASARYIGAVPDIMKEFEIRSGHQIHAKLAPYARTELDLRHGNCDFSIVVWAAQRATYAEKGMVISHLEFGVRARAGLALKRYTDLYGMRISTVRGLLIDPQFDADAALNKDVVVDYTTGVKKTALNRDSRAVAGSLAAINQVISQLQLEDQFGDALVLRNMEVVVAFSKKSTQIHTMSAVNAVFASMVSDGTIKKIMDRWSSAPASVFTAKPPARSRAQ